MRYKAIAHAVLAALALAPAAALAISDDDVNRTLQFNFSNPGARSLGIAGAFTGLADDATASYANPAGLVNLRKMEFGLEARYTDFESSYVSGGELFLDPYDSSDVGEGSSSDSVSQLSFASWVYPTERAVFSLFYHRVGDFEGSLDSEATEFFDRPGTGALGQIAAANGSMSFDVQNIGAAVGFRASDSFSIGASIAYSDFTISSRAQRVANDDVLNIQRQSGSDDDVVFTVGALWQINSQWNFGLAYRSGGDFEYKGSNELPDGSDRIDKNPGFAVPNVLSAGLTFRPTDVWLFSLDVNHVEYSRLSDDIVSVYLRDDVDLSFEDGTEIRLGGEYQFINMKVPMTLRAGVWLDPDHRLAYDGPAPGDCFADDAAFGVCEQAALYPDGDDETHLSLGIGWSFTSFQLDFAADFSDSVDTFSASGVMRF